MISAINGHGVVTHLTVLSNLKITPLTHGGIITDYTHKLIRDLNCFHLQLSNYASKQV